MYRDTISSPYRACPEPAREPQTGTRNIGCPSETRSEPEATPQIGLRKRNTPSAIRKNCFRMVQRRKRVQSENHTIPSADNSRSSGKNTGKPIR